MNVTQYIINLSRQEANKLVVRYMEKLRFLLGEFPEIELEHDNLSIRLRGATVSVQVEKVYNGDVIKATLDGLVYFALALLNQFNTGLREPTNETDI